MILALANSKGGVGKSTIAVHAAVWLRERGLDVTVIDADEQASSTQWLTRAAPDIPVHAFTQRPEIVAKTPVLAKRCDAVVLDAPAALNDAFIATVAVAQLVLLPVGPSMMDVFASYRAARLIYRTRFQKLRGKLEAITIINRVQPRSRLTRVAATAVVRFGFPVARTVLQLRQAYAEACGDGTVVWRMGAPGRRASAEINGLFDEILLPRLPR